MKEVTLKINNGDKTIEELAHFLEPQFEVSYLVNSDEIKVTKKPQPKIAPMETDEFDNYQRTLMRKCVLLSFRTHNIVDGQHLSKETAQLINLTAMAFFEKQCQHKHYWTQANKPKGVKKDGD